MVAAEPNCSMTTRSRVKSVCSTATTSHLSHVEQSLLQQPASSNSPFKLTARTSSGRTQDRNRGLRLDLKYPSAASANNARCRCGKGCLRNFGIEQTPNTRSYSDTLAIKNGNDWRVGWEVCNVADSDAVMKVISYR
jgi:hypothetical protein